jgi:hypothetical protein
VRDLISPASGTVGGPGRLAPYSPTGVDCAPMIVAEYGTALPPTITCTSCGRAIGTYSGPLKDDHGDVLPLALQDLRAFDGLVAQLRDSVKYRDDLAPYVRQQIEDTANRAQQARDELARRLDEMADAYRMLVDGPRH